MNRWQRVHLVVAVILGLLEGVLVLLSYVVDGDRIPGAAVWGAFALAFPVFGAAMIQMLVVSRSRPRLEPLFRQGPWARKTEENKYLWQRARQRVPIWVMAIIVATWVVTWIAADSSMGHVPGQPERHGTRYFADDHGYLIPLSKAEYEHELALWYRGFAAIPMTFYAISVALILTATPGTVVYRSQSWSPAT